MIQINATHFYKKKTNLQQKKKSPTKITYQKQHAHIAYTYQKTCKQITLYFKRELDFNQYKNSPTN